MTKRQRIKCWPHFFEKPEEEGRYTSTKILGILYDMVERVDFTPSYDLEPNQAILDAFELTEAELQWALELKEEYDAAV